jgi:hypothetical protein
MALLVAGDAAVSASLALVASLAANLIGNCIDASGGVVRAGNVVERE